MCYALFLGCVRIRQLPVFLLEIVSKEIAASEAPASSVRSHNATSSALVANSDRTQPKRLQTMYILADVKDRFA
jgi:hypothetical protein